MSSLHCTCAVAKDEGVETQNSPAVPASVATPISTKNSQVCYVTLMSLKNTIYFSPILLQKLRVHYVEKTW